MEKKRIVVASALVYILYLVIAVFALHPPISTVQYNLISGAHRGESVRYVENTLQAIESATGDKGYEFVEFDIQYTKDEKIVVYHDASLLRLHKRPDKIRDLTYQEVQEKTDFSVPLYEQVIEVIGNSKKINLEIKSSGNFEKDKQLVDFVVSDLEARQVLSDTMISSISGDIVEYINHQYPSIKTGQVFYVVPSTFFNNKIFTQDLYEKVEESNAEYIMLHGSNIRNLENLLELKPKDKIICFWYFNNEMYIVQTSEEDCIW